MDRRIAAAAGLALSCAAAPHAHAQFTYRTVAQSGVSGFTDFDIALIANTGITVFSGEHSGYGIWAEDGSPGLLAKLAGVNETLAGSCATQAPIESLTRPSMSGNGSVAFGAFAQGGACNCGGGADLFDGFFLWRPGTGLETMAESGQPVDLGTLSEVNPSLYPSQSAGSQLFQPRVTDAGVVSVYEPIAVCGSSNPFGLRSAIMTAASTGITAHAVTGISNIADFTGVLKGTSMSTPSLAGTATSVFYAKRSDDTDEVTNDPNGVDFGIMIGSPTGGPSWIFVEGDPAPGAGIFRFSELDFHPAINDNLQIAFYARTAVRTTNPLTGLFEYGHTGGGIWRGTSSNSSSYLPVAMHGDQAPSLPHGVVFSGFGDPVINATGQLAFVAYLAGAGVTTLNDFAVYRAIPDGQGGFTLDVIAREGDEAPGTSGVFVGDLPNGSPFRDPFINASGQVAYQANWHSNPGSVGVGGPGIWLDTPVSGTTAVVANLLFGIPVADTRLGSGQASASGESLASASGGQDGRGTALNDAGEVVFIVKLNGLIGQNDQSVVVASPSSPIMLATDFDADGYTGAGDLSLLFEAFDTQNSRYDINADGVVDMRDVRIVLNAMTSR